MARAERRIAVTIAAGLLCLLAVGCQQPEMPQAKRARLIAAQNMEQEQALADLNAKIEKLKSQYEQQIKEKDEQLAACRKKIEDLQNEVQKALAERISQVTAAVLDENARLRKEVENLRVRLEQRTGGGQQTVENKPQP